MIQLLILTITTLMLCHDFKKTFVIIMTLNTWLSCFAGLPGLPINLFDWISLIAFVLSPFFVDIKNVYTRKMPLAIALALIIISRILTNVYGIYPHTPSMIVGIVRLLNIFTFYHIVSTNHRYIRTFVKTCFVYGSIVAVYALFETAFKTNPYIVFVNETNLYTYESFISDIRFFLKRSQSIFAMHTTCGAVAMTLSFVLIYIRLHTTRMLNDYKWLQVVLPLLVATIFFTGARSAIAGCLISMSAFMDIKRMKYLVIPTLMVVVLVFISPDYISQVYNSFVNTDSVSGSNTDMRDVQLKISMYYFLHSPWIGNGLAYTWEHVKAFHTQEILGAESLWFPIMIDQGALGIFSYLFYVVSMLIYVIAGGVNLLLS